MHLAGSNSRPGISPSAGAEGGRGGACAHVWCSEAHTQGKPPSPRQSGRVRRPAPTALAPRGWQAGPRLTLECLLGESLPAVSCLEACLLPLLPAMAESRAWAGTCHKGSALRWETHQWSEVTQALAQVHPKNLVLNVVGWSHPSASLSAQLTHGHDPHQLMSWGLTTLSNRIFTEHLLCARHHSSA